MGAEATCLPAVFLQGQCPVRTENGQGPCAERNVRADTYSIWREGLRRVPVRRENVRADTYSIWRGQILEGFAEGPSVEGQLGVASEGVGVSSLRQAGTKATCLKANPHADKGNAGLGCTGYVSACLVHVSTQKLIRAPKA
eukprot:1138533-Pelagomonas_calceolata.AAC.4